MHIRIAILLIFSLFFSFAPVAPAMTGSVAYVDPALMASQTEILSVIVAAGSSTQAAAAVEHLGGTITSDLWLIDAVGARIASVKLDALAHHPGIRSLVANKGIETAQSPAPDGSDAEGWVTSFRYPVPWDGTPDVQPGMAHDGLRLTYPTSIDVGANKLQGNWDGSAYPLILGKGIGIAIIDSGVYFSDETRQTLGAQAAHAFIGQADFVGEGQCSEVGTGKYRNSIQQQADHCWTDYYMSEDPYGHGSHVAGIIWNPYWDEKTWARGGIAPEAGILSVRVLDQNGAGSYEDAIEGIQYVVANKEVHGIRVMNLSMSAAATVPYVVDPLNRAVESAWAAGIVVVAAAGNMGPQAETITVPGNDPYVITVGAVDGQRTAGYWTDDRLPKWSSTGPTGDGFVKPDVLAPGAQLVSFMHNSGPGAADTAQLVTSHPDYSETSDFFRMNGTSMATAVASGVIALMLEANPNLTPNQVKFRLMVSARPAIHDDDIGYNLLQQGAGRIWAPHAVYGDFPADGAANVGMDIIADLAHGYATEADLAYHYQGPMRKQISDDGRSVLYHAETTDGNVYGFGSVDIDSHEWLSLETLNSRLPTWSGSFGAWGSGPGIWVRRLLPWRGAAHLVRPSTHMEWRHGPLVGWLAHLGWWSAHVEWWHGAVVGRYGPLVGWLAHLVRRS